MFSAEQLLHPISPAEPAGVSLAYSPELDAIERARAFDDPSLDQGEWVTTLKEADWDYVLTRSAGLLATRSKDLRLAVRLTEAAAKLHHLRGLAEGLRLLAGLLESFWDQGLYPEAEHGDQEQRIGNLNWMLSRIPALVREMPVTDGNGRTYSALELDVARKVPVDERKLADMEAARRANSNAFRTAFAADAQVCLEALEVLERVADRRLGNDAPGFVNARDALQDMQRLVPPPAAMAQPTALDDSNGDTNDAHGAASLDAGPARVINSRQQAIAQLRIIAEYFRRTEPHSPVSYFADKAASTAEQDLHTWLRAVVKDSASLAHIEEILGVQT